VAAPCRLLLCPVVWTLGCYRIPALPHSHSGVNARSICANITTTTTTSRAVFDWSNNSASNVSRLPRTHHCLVQCQNADVQWCRPVTKCGRLLEDLYCGVESRHSLLAWNWNWRHRNISELALVIAPTIAAPINSFIQQERNMLPWLFRTLQRYSFPSYALAVTGK
jgi:hypothetical protein